MSNNLACRVCGNLQLEPPWGDDYETPSFDICDCCGVEFGYGDHTLKAIHSSRQGWLENNANWRYPQFKANDYSFEKQMENIPNEYK